MGGIIGITSGRYYQNCKKNLGVQIQKLTIHICALANILHLNLTYNIIRMSKYLFLTPGLSNKYMQGMAGISKQTDKLTQFSKRAPCSN